MKKLVVAGMMVLLASGTAFAGEPAAAGAEQTCGQKIAAKAVLPTQMAVVMNSVADTFDAHAKWMTATKTKESMAEAKALTKLGKEHRAIAASYTKLAANMQKLASLPGAPHDPKLIDPGTSAAIKAQLDAMSEMMKLMHKEQAELEQMQKMLAAAPK
jgi:hypothetical protein